MDIGNINVKVEIINDHFRDPEPEFSIVRLLKPKKRPKFLICPTPCHNPIFDDFLKNKGVAEHIVIEKCSAMGPTQSISPLQYGKNKELQDLNHFMKELKRRFGNGQSYR